MKFRSRGSPTMAFWSLDVVFEDGNYDSSRVEDRVRRAEVEAVLITHPEVEAVPETPAEEK